MKAQGLPQTILTIKSLRLVAIVVYPHRCLSVRPRGFLKGILPRENNTPAHVEHVGVANVLANRKIKLGHSYVYLNLPRLQ
jgi:hypothetical protein